MKIDMKWIIREHFSLEKMKDEIKAKADNFRRVVFAMADKLDKGKTKTDTKFFETKFGSKTLKFSKVAKNIVTINESLLNKILGKKAKELYDKKIIFSEEEFLEAEKKLPVTIKKAISKFLKIENIPNEEKLEEAFKQGIISEKNFLRIIKIDDTKYSVRVSEIKQKEKEESNEEV